MGDASEKQMCSHVSGGCAALPQKSSVLRGVTSQAQGRSQLLHLREILCLELGNLTDGLWGVIPLSCLGQLGWVLYFKQGQSGPVLMTLVKVCKSSLIRRGWVCLDLKDKK